MLHKLIVSEGTSFPDKTADCEPATTSIAGSVPRINLIFVRSGGHIGGYFSFGRVVGQLLTKQV